MKRTKLLAALGDFLDGKKRKKQKHLDELRTLLAKLQVKKAALEEKITVEKNKHKHERLSKELDVLDAQLAKGVKALQQLEGG